MALLMEMTITHFSCSFNIILQPIPTFIDIVLIGGAFIICLKILRIKKYTLVINCFEHLKTLFFRISGIQKTYRKKGQNVEALRSK